MQIYRERKFPLRIACAIPLLCIFYSCSNASKTPADTLVIALGTPTQTINPLYTMDTDSQHINELVHASLIVMSPQLTPEPYLAESFKAENDTTISFKLRKGCKFPNGKDITARDVERSVAAYLDPKLESSFAKSSFERIKKVEVIDDYSFKIITDKPTPSLLTDLELLKIFQIDGEDLASKPKSVPGAGPFNMVNFGTSDYIMERSNQPCLPIPASSKAMIRVVRDDLSRFLKLKRGEIDIVLNDMNYRKVSMVMNDPSLPMNAIAIDSASYAYMGVNQTKENLRDPRVRKALALSFDIPTLIKYKNKGMGKPARNMLADMNAYANLDIPLKTRNIEEARRLLDEAGYSNGSNGKPPLKVTFTTSSNMIAVENARVLTAQAREAGIQLTHRAFDWGVFFADVKAGNSEVYTLSWTGVTDPHLYYELFHSSQIGRNNRTRYSNPEMDKLIEQGDATLDVAKRKAIYKKVQEIAADDLPFISLWHPMNTAVFRKNVKGVTLHPMGTWRVILAMSKEAELPQ